MRLDMLRSEVIQRRLLSEKDLTLESAYDIAHGLETVSQRASELQATVKTAATAAGGVQRGQSHKTLRPPRVVTGAEKQDTTQTAVITKLSCVATAKRKVT